MAPRLILRRSGGRFKESPTGKTIKEIHLDGKTVTVGRSSSATYSIPNKFLSELQARMKLDDTGTGWTIEDLNSSNGTFLNAVRLRPNIPFRLSIGDKVGFGIAVYLKNSISDGLVYRVCKNDSEPPTLSKAEPSRSENNQVPLIDLCSDSDSECEQQVTALTKKFKVDPKNESAVSERLTNASTTANVSSKFDEDEFGDMLLNFGANYSLENEVVVIEGADSENDITVVMEQVKERKDELQPTNDEQDGQIDDGWSILFEKISKTELNLIVKKELIDTTEQDSHEVPVATLDGNIGGSESSVPHVKREVGDEESPSRLSEISMQSMRTDDYFENQGTGSVTSSRQEADDFFPQLSQSFCDTKSASMCTSNVAVDGKPPLTTVQPRKSFPVDRLKLSNDASKEAAAWLLTDARPIRPVRRRIRKVKTNDKDKAVKELPQKGKLKKEKPVKAKPKKRKPVKDKPKKGKPVKDKPKKGKPKKVKQKKPLKILAKTSTKKMSLKKIVLKNAEYRILAGLSSSIRVKSIMPSKLSERGTSSTYRTEVDDDNERAVPVPVSNLNNCNSRKREKMRHKVVHRERPSRADRFVDAVVIADLCQQQHLPVKKRSVPPVTRTATKNVTPFASSSYATCPSAAAPQASHDECPQRPSAGETSVERRVRFADDIEVRPLHAEQVRTIQPELGLKPSSGLDGAALNVLRRVLNWKTTWFEEEKGSGTIPPVIAHKELLRTKLSYKSANEYADTYKPLMLLETWEKVASSQSKKIQIFYMELVSVTPCYENYDPCTTLLMQWKFNVVLPKYMEDSRYCPTEGWLAMLLIPLHSSATSERREYVKQLAYIVSTRKTNFAHFQNSELVTPLTLCLAANQLGAEKILLTIDLRTMSKAMNPKRDIVFKLSLITKFGKRLQLFESVAAVASTALGRALLDPEINLSLLPSIDPPFKILSRGTVVFNQKQTEAILRVTKACVTEPEVPTVAMINGPPGTGKTLTIAGLITQLLYGSHVQTESKPFILLCATSNNALDEVVLRLQDMQPEQFKKQGCLRILRLGQFNLVNEKVRAIHVDNLIKKNMFLMVNRQKHCEQIVKKLINRIGSLIQKLRNTEKWDDLSIDDAAKLRQDVVKWENHLGELEVALQEYTLQCAMTTWDNQCYAKFRRHLVTKSQVIATPLGSCIKAAGMESLKSNDRQQQIICIVDEATRSFEPDLLAILIKYGITKLVLVGDSMQLPLTARSSVSRRMGYEQSLFQRLHESFKGVINTPIISLNEQYRKNAEICQ